MSVVESLPLAWTVHGAVRPLTVPLGNAPFLKMGPFALVLLLPVLFLGHNVRQLPTALQPVGMVLVWSLLTLMAIGIAWSVLPLLRLRIHREPYLRLDETGITLAGQPTIPWREVRAIEMDVPVGIAVLLDDNRPFLRSVSPGWQARLRPRDGSTKYVSLRWLGASDAFVPAFMAARAWLAFASGEESIDATEGAPPT